MSMTTKTTGLGRKIFYDVFTVEQAKIPQYWKELVGKELNTTQTYEIFRQMKGLGPAAITPEGESAVFDDLAPIYSMTSTPFMVTLGTRYTKLWDFTNQYADIRAKQPQFARSFSYSKNQIVANMFNLGFTDTTYGMNSEVLFSASHATLIGTTQSNTTSEVLSPLAIERAVAILMRQKNPQGLPMPVSGKLRLTVPPELYQPALRYTEATRLPTTNNNDPNVLNRFVIEVVVNPYLTSSTAWFLTSVDPEENKTFLLKQLPYEIEQLAMTADFFTTWVASESYTVGWQDWRGTFGSPGA